jgi:phosphoserine aminotransferase
MKLAQPHNRIFNFSAGPGTLPLSVLEQAQAELLNYAGTGMSVMEMSHRSAAFDDILARAENNLRSLLGIPANYKVLFLQGGATQQFAMVPMNLLPAGGSADYLCTGSWGNGAFKEAQKFGAVRAAANTAASNHNFMPAQAELDLDPQAANLHFTTNETIHGVEYAPDAEPTPPSGVPLVCDMSSDFLSHPVNVAKYGLIYGGAQKNLGPAGVTIVIVRDDLLNRVPPGDGSRRPLPIMLDYTLQAEHKSLYNTPPCYSIYMVGLVLQWLTDMGGLEEVARRNAAKAAVVYNAIESSGGFYIGHARADSRSLMNVTFKLAEAELEKKFIHESTAEGLDGLKGHRSLGGMRASIYNAFPQEGVEALAQFMAEFQRRNG